MTKNIRCLLDADYISEGEKAVIRLFYKTPEGREIVRVEDFKPYFYAVPKINSEECIENLIKEIEDLITKNVGYFPKIRDISVVERIYFGKKIKVLKIVVTHPKDVPKLRNDIAELENCKEVMEADIPFAHRYIIDSGLVPMENSELIKLKIAAFDIEVYNPRGEPQAEKDPVLMISYSDTENLRKVFSTKGAFLDLDFLEIASNEAEMFKRFVELVKEREIDILVSYNGDNFDLPYLKERGKKLGVKITLGYDASEVKLERRGMNLGAKIRGRPHIDLFPITRQLFNLPRYKLEDVYLELFGEEKIDIKSSDLPKMWDSENPRDLKLLFLYSMSDATSTLKIALALLPLQYELSKLIRLPLYECSRAASGQRVEHLLISEAFKRGILVPNKPSDEEVERRQMETYTGAYVVEPIKGIHDNIVLFDFRSLYPSIIISHNIDPSTIDCECCKAVAERTPTGHHFCKRRRGFIPEVLEKLIERRMEIKKLMKLEKDEKKRRMLDVEQQALKILANSTYGYFGFPRARWYSKECAETIAALGRKYIHKTIEKAKEYGFEVIYGDTDSVYLTRKDSKTKDEILSHAKKFLEDINKELPGAMELEFEGFYPRGIFITKKRYALIDEYGMLTVKGLETRRRDWAKIAKETQNKVLDAILKEKDVEKAVSIVKDVIRRIKSGEVSLEELAIHTQITRDIRSYVQEGPHIAAAKKAMKRGYEFPKGSIVTYIITKKSGSISDKAELIDFVKEGDYDPDYYINNQVLPAVLRILEALGYSEDELKGRGKQLTLDSFS